MAVITLSKVVAAGAREVGQAVAKALNYEYVDKQLVTTLAAQVGVSEKTVEEYSEQHSNIKAILSKYFDLYSEPTAPSQIPKGFPELGKDAPEELMQSGYLDSAVYKEKMEAVIKDFAKQGNVVIIGRGAQVILQEFPNTYHFRLVAPMEFRIRRARGVLNFKGDDGSIQTILERADERARYYVEYYHKWDVTDPLLYHAILNTQRLGIDGTVKAIVSQIK